MARSKSHPIRAKLSELQPGQYADCYALLADRTKSMTREGKPFFTCRFRDLNRIVTAMIWEDSDFYSDCEKAWKTGRCYKLRVQFQQHERYGPQIEIEAIREITDQDREEGFQESDIVERSLFNPQELFDELLTINLKENRNLGYQSLVSLVMETYRSRLLLLPGSQRHYYPFIGGWLEHTRNVTRTVIQLADYYLTQYPTRAVHFNRDLAITGAMLHDVGRIGELDTNPLPEQTISGKMVGHIILGRDLVRDLVPKVEGLTPSDWRLLEHLLLSYLSLPEWGSPRLPLIPEVLMIHHADDLDAKLEMYHRCLSRDSSEGTFTERDPILGRALLRVRELDG
ncbi:HD domain-containing protein [Tuwongella immobilis]|uniref:HD/PDEase domain-containing protein n=1 Tax=Tuwongella immobilis TaxID=692036 RepID=A0A6C2YPA7_9BACT|nr:HD domain-containing protein [Tuwongella immobilis]VIP03197.1 Metal dependent phosphohydrolase OS=Planctomyces brasiliensis (strain ATCC 49424 / DSM 5305 / JCM 21570 / NBRC 103401 / IFAM 1448) GN=Plabr_1993 PE=4 SV=1: HD [Tuwongella immobilis]VTS03678.1 Metal dependent phosphohydrolase OS=Planctomyces brasiliensis (strain ATCC 49424 / DSM 5305 / JCM 21570 / NBRC 103401 / IFAM 1448) GN=Plabr_1993 PE=4 SV=1: HD [Tuwongella immobilis]